MLLRHADSSPVFGLSQLLCALLEDSFTYQVETQSVHIKAPARHIGKSCVTRSQNASGSKVRLRAVRLPVHQARRRYRLKRFLDLWQGWGWWGVIPGCRSQTGPGGSRRGW